MNKRALISVYNKDGIVQLVSCLAEAGWEILSTGGTSRHLRENKIPVTDVASVTGFPECLDGRVKTLHPAIHAGLLARRGERAHMDTLEKLGLGTIDLVCVNLYPFFEKVQAGLSWEETTEFIDIGGPSMLRSAAKNYRDVIVLCDPADYSKIMADLPLGGPAEDLKRHLAGKVFALTSAYDGAVARYMLQPDKKVPRSPAGVEDQTGEEDLERRFPPFWPQALKKGQPLRYGENGHQKAALYLSADRPGALAGMEQLNGKELGYNNIRDLDLAWKTACAFGFPPEGRPPLGKEDFLRLGAGVHSGTGVQLPADPCPVCCVAVKHNSPCGIALGPDPLGAYEKAYACDPVSIFGGIAAFTARVDAATAAKLAELFLEIVAAPDFDGEALGILKKKKNLRIMRARYAPRDEIECTAVDGGLLVQDVDRGLLEKWEVATRAQPEEGDLPDLIFGMRAVSFVKSNAIVVVKDETALGIGGGQTNRIWAAEQALERSRAAVRAALENPALAGKPLADGRPARVLASDAFFPFSDVVDAAAAAGVKAIIQPGGSIRDAESVEACDRHGIAMVLTGTRHFKH
ncbi:MAG: bifunctional phosphoribosylaminoimidazolecarboxamide formyltransferase/IMP cyclohydrolase [Treponema sp.]|jgi:phosphoribosylaminoimidazolecarboxamide formyltransferase/IMP cyclohydrolase|nr:bifunctional phosphoribosylaminoimidazolecarboxamide formyltransferase/IMP cyclohydrolase [Treponema sp.]